MFTTNFVVSTAQILRKNKEPNIIIYSEFHVILKYKQNTIYQTISVKHKGT